MSVFDRLVFYYWDDVGMVASAIEQWHPKNCKTEKDYEKSLYEYLNIKFDSIPVTKQYAHGRIKADIVVGGDDRVIIEVKYNLVGRSEYQRLIGQLTEYEEWNGSIIILLIGDIDPDFEKSLHRFIDNKSSDWDKRFYLIRK